MQDDGATRHARRRRSMILAAIAVGAVLALFAAILAASVAGSYWDEKCLSSPHGVPYSPEGALRKLIRRITGQ